MYRQILKLLNSLLGCFLVICMFAMVVTVLWQVFTRFVLNDPANGTDELSTYLLVWIGLVGAAYTYGLKKHLALEILREKLKGNNKILLDMLIQVIILTFTVISLLYGGIAFDVSTFAHHQISPGLVIFGHRLYMGVVFLAMPITGGFIVLFGIDALFTDLKLLIGGK